jgi:hypothetical protein
MPARSATVTATGLLLLLSGCAAPPAAIASHAVPDRAATPVGHAELDIAGTWHGELDDRGHGVLRMSVSPDGELATAFDAEVTFHGRDGERTTSARGELTPHGHLVIEVDADASIEAHITDPLTLDYCFVVYGLSPVYSCGRLVHD